jgi:membrane protease YdiL (CAAX protease family)
MPATGFQIAILIFALHFFVLFAIRVGSERLSWPQDPYADLYNFVTFGLLMLALLAIAPIRRYCQEELRRPIPPNGGREAALVTTGMVAIPFAMAGTTVLAAFAAGEPALLPSKLLSADPIQSWERSLSFMGAMKILFISCFAAPIVEELLFRGLLYRAWERQWGWIPSLVLTSLCFGLFHIHNFIATSLISVVLICMLRRTGTLRATILAHMGFNFLVSWPFMGHLLLTIEGRDINRMSTWSAELASLVFVAVALPAYLAMSRRDAREAVVR